MTPGPSTPAAPPIRVLLVDDDPLVRSALTLMLGGQPDLQIVGEAANGAEGLDLVASARPDVVLMDIRMPVMNGLDATRALHSRPSPPAVVVLTTFDADDQVVSAIAAGADGFLLKDTPPADIVAAVRLVSNGEAMLSPVATRTLIERVRNDPSSDRSGRASTLVGRLTEREREVAVCVGKGHSNADIAAELHLSVPTVKAHVSRLLEKLEASNRVQVAICLRDAGLV